MKSWLLLSFLILAAACTQLSVPPAEPEEPEEVVVIEPEPEPIFFVGSSTAPEIQQAINGATDKTYVFTDEGMFSKGNVLKNYVIETHDTVESFEEYCETHCAKNWQGFTYYIDEVAWRELSTAKIRYNFTSDQNYKNYREGKTFVDHKILAQTYSVENGKVTEYQFIAWEKDDDDVFVNEYGIEDTLLLYSFICTPEQTVHLRPDVLDTRLRVSGQLVNATLRNWDATVLRVRNDMLEEANTILESCTVQPEFFEDQGFNKEENLFYETI